MNELRVESGQPDGGESHCRTIREEQVADAPYQNYRRHAEANAQQTCQMHGQGSSVPRKSLVGAVDVPILVVVRRARRRVGPVRIGRKQRRQIAAVHPESDGSRQPIIEWRLCRFLCQ